MGRGQSSVFLSPYVRGNCEPRVISPGSTQALMSPNLVWVTQFMRQLLVPRPWCGRRKWNGCYFSVYIALSIRYLLIYHAQIMCHQNNVERPRQRVEKTKEKQSAEFTTQAILPFSISTFSSIHQDPWFLCEVGITRLPKPKKRINLGDPSHSLRPNG